MEGIMPETRRKMSIGLADVERAQKFRERAKSTTVGKPEFRVSNKREGKYCDNNIYKTLGSHPDLLELKAQNSGQLYNGPRRISDDRTSNCNSINDEESGIVNITHSFPQGECETFVSRDSQENNNQHYLLSAADSIATTMMEQL